MTLEGGGGGDGQDAILEVWVTSFKTIIVIIVARLQSGDNVPILLMKSIQPFSPDEAR
jgi:hypothetical protein